MPNEADQSSPRPEPACRLRVGIVAPGQVFPPWPSASVARVTEALIRGLMQAGHQVTVFAAANSRLDCELVPVCDDGIVLAWDPGFGKFRAAEQRRSNPSTESGTVWISCTARDLMSATSTALGSWRR